MTDLWKKYAADFDGSTDEHIEREVRNCEDEIELLTNWLEAVASWKAAGKPRNIDPASVKDRA